MGRGGGGWDSTEPHLDPPLAHDKHKISVHELKVNFHLFDKTCKPLLTLVFNVRMLI